MRRAFPPCEEVYGNPDINISSRGLDLLDLRLEHRASANSVDKNSRRCGHNFSKRTESETGEHNSSSYASSSNSSTLSKTKQIAKLFNPDKKSRRSNNKLKSSGAATKFNYASNNDNMRMVERSSKQVLPEAGDYHNDSKLGLRDSSPVSKRHNIPNPDGDHTDTVRKLNNPTSLLNAKQRSRQKSTKFSKSRKRTTVPGEKEEKTDSRCGDYFQPSDRVKVLSAIKVSPEEIFPVKHPNSSDVVLKDRLCPTLERKFMNEDGGETVVEEAAECDRLEEDECSLRINMGIFKKRMDIKRVCAPRKKSIREALYERVAYFLNPDIAVTIDSYVFKCHKIVLQCYSEYFEQLTTEREVDIDGITKTAFIAIYQWMLAPDNEELRCITKDNILEVLIASKKLLIKELENQCLAFIDSKEVFTEENAFSLFIDASRSCQTEIMELMVPRIQEFFLVLVSSYEYTILELDDLCTILQSNYIVVHCEFEVFMSAVKWLMFDWEERSKHLRAIMKCIRFGLMTPAQLVDIRKNPNSPEFREIAKDKMVQQLIEDGLAYSVERGMSEKQDLHAERCDLLQLKIPEPRNWANKSKDYRMYVEFLVYLTEISANPQSFYSEVKEDNLRAETNLSAKGTSNPSSSSDESDGSEINRLKQNVIKASSTKPSLSDILCKERSTTNLTVTEVSDQKRGKSELSEVKLSTELWTQNEKTTLRNWDIFHETKAKQVLKAAKSSRKMSLRDRAAVVIQATYRGYAVRKRLQNRVKIDKNDSKSSQKSPLDRMFLQVKNTDNSNHDTSTDDELPQIWKRGRRKLKSKTKFKRSSSTDSNESIVSVKECPASFRRMPLPYHHTKSLILTGGADPTSKHPSGHEACQVYRFSLESNSWAKIGKMPSPRYYHGSTVLKGRVYIVGGCNPEDEDNNIPSLCTENCSYEPISHTWRKEPGLKTPRRSFGLVTFCDHLYAIGGQDMNDKNVSSVERFDPTRKIWEEVAPLPEPHIGAAICVYKNLIWVAGGVIGGSSNVTVSKAVWCYDPRQDVWIKKPYLRSGRGFASLATYGDYLFLVGGITCENGSDIVSNDHIDVWDGETGVWKLKGNIDPPRHGHSVAFIGSLMILMGGVSTTNDTGFNRVDSLCMVTGRSKQIAPLPSPLVGQSCVLLPPISEV